MHTAPGPWGPQYLSPGGGPAVLIHRFWREQLMINCRSTYLDANSLHVKFQSAYISCHSTDSALLSRLNDLLAVIGRGNNALLVLLDLSASFDTIYHTLLLNWFHLEICVDNTVLNWFSSYLSCRSQQVFIRHSFSVETPPICGVPQGSVLCPLLCSLCTRQLAELIQRFASITNFFANDSELCSCLPTEREPVLRVIGKVESCCREIRK